MKDIRILLKEAIKSTSTLKDFSSKNKLRLASVSEFLSGKLDIQTSSFLKILKAVDFEIIKKVTNQKYISKKSTNYNSNIYTVGDRVRLHNTTFYLNHNATHIIKEIFLNGSRKLFLFESISTGERELILF